jgi:very-short-patch-repair endonuclease
MAQDSHLLSRARHLRNNGTPFEAKLWLHISRSQLAGYKFRRQHVIGNCIVDFFCPQKALILEIDGDTHDDRRDRRRDRINEFRGYTTIRFSNEDVGKNIDGVLARLLETLQGLSDRWPHPSPSPEREGK